MTNRRNIRRRILAVALSTGAVAMLALAPPAGSAQAPVHLPDCSNTHYGGNEAPAAWSATCVGSSVNLSALQWSSWGAPLAVATGIRDYNSCDPYCSEGTIYQFPAELRAENIRKCASARGAAYFYTRLTVVTTFPPANAVGEPAGASAPFVFDATCPTAGYLIPTHSKTAQFGAFDEASGSAADHIESLFGPPSSTATGRYGTCIKRWVRLGLKAEFGLYGQDGDACYSGYFFRASMTSSRWHTKSGVRPGGRASRARRASVRRCSGYQCNRHRGYILSLHRSECAAGLWPTVYAETAGSRVKRIVVNKTGCE